MEKTVANRIAFAQTRDLLLEGQNVRICVQGQSMLPFFRSGSVITLRPLRHEDLRRGAVVMAETVQGNFVVHRIIQATPEEVTLLGDGNLTTETMPPAKVYGVVDCSAIHRVLARVWLWLRPVRRARLMELWIVVPFTVYWLGHGSVCAPYDVIRSGFCGGFAENNSRIGFKQELCSLFL